MWNKLDKDEGGCMDKDKCIDFVKDLCKKCDTKDVCSCTECKFGDIFDKVDTCGNGTLDKEKLANFIK